MNWFMNIYDRYGKAVRVAQSVDSEPQERELLRVAALGQTPDHLPFTIATFRTAEEAQSAAQGSANSNIGSQRA